MWGQLEVETEQRQVPVLALCFPFELKEKLDSPQDTFWREESVNYFFNLFFSWPDNAIAMLVLLISIVASHCPWVICHNVERAEH